MGKPQEPIARRTNFGWIAVRPIGKPRKYPHTYHVTRVESETETLDVAFKQFWDSESFGTKTINSPVYTKDEQRAMNMLHQETRKLETGYEVLLLWKEDEPSLENNRLIAEMFREILSLKRTIVKLLINTWRMVMLTK